MLNLTPFFALGWKNTSNRWYFSRCCFLTTLILMAWSHTLMLGVFLSEFRSDLGSLMSRLGKGCLTAFTSSWRRWDFRTPNFWEVFISCWT